MIGWLLFLVLFVEILHTQIDIFLPLRSILRLIQCLEFLENHHRHYLRHLVARLRFCVHNYTIPLYNIIWHSNNTQKPPSSWATRGRYITKMLPSYCCMLSAPFLSLFIFTFAVAALAAAAHTKKKTICHSQQKIYFFPLNCFFFITCLLM